MRDIRYALRTLSRSPGLSLAAILVLALGIGANSAIFTVVRAVLLAPLPYRDPDRLVRLYERDVVGTSPFNVASAANFYDWQRDATSFESMGYWGDWQTSLTPSDGGLPETLDAAICDAGFFPTLGVQPQLGRVFRPEDDRKDAPLVAIISDSLWRRRFGTNPSVIGSIVRLYSQTYTIIGVMPPQFDFPTAATSVWFTVSAHLDPSFRVNRGNHRFSVVARLKPGVSIEQARSEVDQIARRIHDQNPNSVTGRGANVASLAERRVSGVRPMLLVLFGAVACVLLIACVNVTNLLLARAMAARREAAVRVALGASRVRIARQFLAESLILSVGGAALGTILAAFGTGMLIKMAGAIPRIETVHVDLSVLVFTAALAMITGIAAGLVPAFTSSRTTLTSAMQDSSRSSTASRGRRVFRDAMIAVEVALSLVLLVGAGLMLKSFEKLRTVDAGFRPDHLLTIRFSLPAQRYTAPAQLTGFYTEVLDRVRAMPGIQAAGLVTVAPLGGHWSDEVFTIDGQPPLPPGQFLDAVIRTADPGYFQAAGIPLKKGRAFTAAERLDADKAIVTETFVSRFLPHEDPLGKRIRFSPKRSFEIVGVVGDTRQNLAAAPEPMMYFPVFRGTDNLSTLVVRASGDPNLLSLPVQKVMRTIDPDLPAVTVRTIDELMFGATQQNRFGLTLIALFAALAVVLASIGLYGVLAYAVSQRTNELGVRIALGAGSSAIARLVVWQGFKPALLGIAAGIAGGIGATRLLQSMLYQVSPTDPFIMTLVVVLLLVISIAACLIPALRATRIDPVIALRAE
ncbi:MAG: ABC transporter permease [Acidobacteriia bacterium]|nr:ABC transporter permease [Terriglobia bacterium]